MSYSQADILETDDRVIGALGLGLVFIAATAGLLGFVSQNTNVFQNTASGFIIQVFLAFGFLFLVSIFANYKGLDFLQDYAYPIIKWCYIFGMGIVVAAMIGFGLLLGGTGGIIIAGIGALFAFIFMRSWSWLEERIKRAAEWLTVAATIVLNEPGMVVLSFIQSVIIFIMSIVELFSIFAWFSYAETSGINEQNTQYIMYGIMFLYFWLSMTIVYYFDGANTFISYARIHNKDPKVGQGLNAASKKLGAITIFALLTTIVTFISQFMFMAGREMRSDRDNPAAMVMGYILQLIGSLIRWLYHLVSFFTLPAIIIRQKGAIDAMSESKDLFGRTFWDKLIGEMGYGYGSFILYLLTGLILSIFGFGYGFIVAAAYLGTTQIGAGIIMAIFALIVGLFSSRFFLKPLYTALVTTMYVYATEGPSALKMISKDRSNLVSYLDKQSADPKFHPSGYSGRF